MIIMLQERVKVRRARYEKEKKNDIKRKNIKVIERNGE